MNEPNDGSAARWWLAPGLVLGAALVVTVLSWTTGLDLAVARWFLACDASVPDGGLHNRWYWLVGYYLPYVLVVAFAAYGLGLLLAGWLGRRRDRLLTGAFLVAVLAIGPGLAVNAILKDYSGRPRPRETTELGGKWDFRPAWDVGTAGKGKSFPSGHVAVPALAIALWYAWRRRQRRLAIAALAGGGVLTAYVAASRMLAGAHFLSDAIWSVAIVVVVAAILDQLLLSRIPAPDPGPGLSRRWWIAGLAGLAAVVAATICCATPFYREYASGVENHRLGSRLWRLEVAASDADVVLRLATSAGDGVACSSRIQAQGFGMPGAGIDHEVVVKPGSVRVAVVPRGWATRRATAITVTIDPETMAMGEVRLGRGDITVIAEPGMRRKPMSLITGRGKVTLPDSWRERRPPPAGDRP
jgi:membrane-associated PAP2 superfamily phosphatase